jgi:beta-glucosidase
LRRLIFTVIVLFLIQDIGISGLRERAIYHKNYIDFNKNGKMDAFENPELEIEKRVDDLLSRMTMEEKTCQMATLYGFGAVCQDELPTEEWNTRVWKDGIANIDEHLNGKWKKTQYSSPASKHVEALNEIQQFFVEETRLGIPVDFTNEGIRGLCQDQATSFPAQIGVGSTWNKELVTKIGEVTGKEARAFGYTNIYSPILDIPRDPRWGRTVECYSEDPYLAGELGLRQVKALQKQGVVSTPKHFAVYSIPKGGRDGYVRTAPQAPWRDVFTLYIEPFRKAFVEGGALGVMASYNAYDGVPMPTNKKFLIEILREKWGFDGYVVSDSRTIRHVHDKHKVAEDYQAAIEYAVKANLNVRTDFETPESYITPLRNLVEEGRLSEEDINKNVRDLLRVKFKLGLFDNPYIEDPAKMDKIPRSEKHLSISQKAARESIILLKNEDKILPLDKKINSVLIAGPLAKEEYGLMSRYGAQNIEVKNVYEGILEKLPQDCIVHYKKGCNVKDAGFPKSDIMEFDMPDSVSIEINKTAELAGKSDVAIVVLGETRKLVGESLTRLNLKLPGYQQHLLKAIHKTGTPTILVLLNGRPLSINWADENIPAIIEGWFPGEFTGDAIADVIFGDYNPGGKLPITFPKHVGQILLNFPHKPGTQAKGWARVQGPLYPFGFGLSYTEFQYSDLKITPEKGRIGSSFQISCNIKNTGPRAGDEIVQLYINDKYSSVVTPTKVLRGFARVHLEKGEKEEVSFGIKPEHLSFYDRNMKFIVEPGEFEIMVGASSEDIRLKKLITIH